MWAGRNGLEERQSRQGYMPRLSVSQLQGFSKGDTACKRLASEWAQWAIIVTSKHHKRFAETCMVAAILVYQEEDASEVGLSAAIGWWQDPSCARQ